MTQEVESNTFTIDSKSYRPGSVQLFKNEESKLQSCLKRKWSCFERYIAHSDEKRHVVSLPAFASIEISDVKKYNVVPQKLVHNAPEMRYVGSKANKLQNHSTKVISLVYKATFQKMLQAVKQFGENWSGKCML